MRSKNEIREKITEYMDRLEFANSFRQEQRERIGELHGVIDALLWVIGDESGAPI